MNSLSYIPARNTPKKPSDGFLNTTAKTGGDVYPFHSLKPGRTINFDDYRFGGSNGQEADDEIMGTGNIYNAEFWQYDSRLGRRWNLDPVDQINISNYAVFGNNPVFMVDWNGDNAGWYVDEDGNTIGEDGEEDDMHYLVTNKYDQQVIQEATGKGEAVSHDRLRQKARLLPTYNERMFFKENVYEEGNKDKEYEYGATSWDAENGSKIVYITFKGTDEMKLDEDGGLLGSVNLTGAKVKHITGRTGAADNWEGGPRYTAHSHNYSTEKFYKELKPRLKPPSRKDYENAHGNLGNIVFDNENRAVYIYTNGNSETQQMTNKGFFKRFENE